MIRLALILIIIYIMGIIGYLIYYNRKAIKGLWFHTVSTLSIPFLKIRILQGFITLLIRFIRRRFFKF